MGGTGTPVGSLWGTSRWSPVDSGLQSSCVHCPCPWVESFEFSVPLVSSLGFLPPLSGWPSVCFEDRKYTQHSLGGRRKAKKKGREPKTGVNTGDQKERLPGRDVFPWLHLKTDVPW